MTIADLHAAFGPRRAVLARELTKRHETVLRGTLGELSLEELRGELTIVVEGPPADTGPEAVPEHVDAAADRLLASGLSARDAARRLAADFGLAKTDAYARVIARIPLEP